MRSAASSFSSATSVPSRRKSTRGAWLAGLALLAASALAIGWLLGWFGSATDPRVAEIHRLRQEMAEKYQAGGGPASFVEATAMMTAMGEIRQRIEALPEELRPQAERGGGSLFRSSMQARIDAYFDARPEQRTAVLDRQIDQEEWFRKAYEATQAVTAAVGGNTAGGTGNPPAGGGPPRGPSEEDRNKWRKAIIDRTSPAERARYVEYRRVIEERRTARGLPPSPWGR
jgi:hypothetical protein